MPPDDGDVLEGGVFIWRQILVTLLTSRNRRGDIARTTSLRLDQHSQVFPVGHSSEKVKAVGINTAADRVAFNGSVQESNPSKRDFPLIASNRRGYRQRFRSRSAALTGLRRLQGSTTTEPYIFVKEQSRRAG